MNINSMLDTSECSVLNKVTFSKSLCLIFAIWICCVEPVSAELRQTFFVPITEDHTRILAIGVNTGNLGDATAPNPDTVHSVVSISANVDGTIVYYDHWEDGYEDDLENPVQASTETFNLDAGDFQVLESDVFTNPRNSMIVLYDGRDRIGSTEQLAVTRAGWRLQEGTLLAGAVEVAPTEDWLDRFEFPVGEDVVANAMFEFSAASIMAGESGAVLNVDNDGDGTVDSTLTLFPGETAVVEDIETGGTILSSDPLQVHLLTGDVGSTFEARWFSLIPLEQWGDSYYSPAGTSALGIDTTILLYNPNDSAITVTQESLAATTLTRTYDNTTAGAISNATTPCGTPLVRTFTVADVFTVQGLNLGFNANHTYRGDIQLSLQAPSGNLVTFLTPNGADANDNYDFLLADGAAGVINDGNLDNTAAPFYDRSVSPSSPLSPFAGEASNGVWTLSICDTFAGDDGTFNRAQLQLIELTSQTPSSSTLGVAAGGLSEFTMPLKSGGHFSTASGEPFFGLAVIDYDNTAHDWGFSLLPEEGLSTVHLTGWAVGRDPTSVTNPTENGSPLWITATGPTTLFVDWDGDPTTGPLTDSEGNQYDESHSLSALQSLQLFDTGDGDQSGARFYTLDATLVAAAWGQDPATASPGAPAIDLGTTVLPLEALRAIKKGLLFDDADSDGSISAGDSVRYQIAITNISDTTVSGITVTDFGLDPNVTYVADSTQVDGVSISDDAGPATPFPLDETGYLLGSLGVGETSTFTFEVVVDDPLPIDVDQLANQAQVNTSSQIEIGSTVTPLATPALSISKTSDAVGDVVGGQTIQYTVTVSNVSGAASRGIKILDNLPEGTSYVAESTTATGFTNNFFGTISVSDTAAGGIAIDGTTGCGVAPIIRTFSIGQTMTVSDVDLGFNADHVWRGDVVVDLISPAPANTRVQLIASDVADSDDNYDLLLDDSSGNPIDDASPDNTAAPLYDRDVSPSNPFAAFNGQNALGTWTLEICDSFTGSDDGTYNSAELRVTGANSTPLVRTNQAAAVNPLLDGEPLQLVLAPDGFQLNPSQTLTLTYSVVVEDPLTANSTVIINTASVTSLEQRQPLSATVADPVTRGAAIGDRVWLDVDGDGFEDVGEPGLPNVTVSLFDPGGDGMSGGGDDVLLATTLTDSNGNYFFDHLPAGAYFVDVDDGTLPTGLTLSSGSSDPSAVVTLAAEEIRDDIDFGYRNADPASAMIGDFLWSDANNDGIQDPGEPGLAGVTVELLDSTGSVVMTVLTGDDGTYLFTGVAPGEYQVRVAASNFLGGNSLENYSVTSGPQSEGANTSNPLTVAAGEVQTDVDFGYRNPSATYSVSDVVWLDLEADGVLDPFETGISGVTVDLLDASGDIIASVSTAADGSFSFDGVEPGSYTLSIADNDGRLIGLGGTTTPGRNRSLAVTVVSADISAVSFGYFGEAALGDRIWSDADGDGVQDANEVGLPGVTVELLDRNGAVINTTITDAFGNYLFEGIVPNQYTARVDSATLPAGFNQTGDPDSTLDHQSVALLILGDSALQLDFGYRNNALADISGNVFSDIDRDGIDDGVGEPGFESVTLALLDSSGNLIATTESDAAGDYSFPDLPAGSYEVQVLDEKGVLADHALTSGLDTRAITLAGTDITGIDFGYARNAGTGSIGDRVWLDGDRDGVQDAGEDGISGVDVELYNTGPDGVFGGGDDVLIATTTTDANGGYIFSQVPPGSYFVDVDGSTLPVGLATTPGTTDPSAVVLLSEDEHLDTLDFGYGGTVGSSAIGDRVWADTDGDGVQDPGEIGIGGITVTVVGPSGIFTTTTRADGSWWVTGLAPGAYTVSADSSTLPAAFGTVPTNGPASREFEVTATADVVTADFGFDGPVLGSIGDLVFLDEDGDGSQGAGEGGIAGVTVNLLDSGGMLVATTTTATDGSYDFTGLIAGDYQVEVSDIAQVLTGLNLSSGSNPSAVISLVAGQDYNDADFPYAPSDGAGSVGSIVWNDIDGNGVRSLGESGLAGVTVAIWNDIDNNGMIDPGVDNLLRSTVTDSNGEYEFLGLPFGDYLVDVTDTFGVLTGFNKTSGTPGVDDNSQADPYAVTLDSGSPSNDTADFGYQATTPRSISGTAFGDRNSDALYNGTETGVAGVPVTLYLDLDGDGIIDPEDPQIGTAITDGSGDYAFVGLPDNRNYVVQVNTADTAVSGQTQTTQAGTVGVQPVALAGGDSIDNDFGFVDTAPSVINPAVIGDRVWVDIDGDGIQDVGEPGIANVDLELYDVGLDGAPGGGDDVLVATVTTGANGGYSFSGLDAGTYFVDPVDATVPTGLTVSAGTSDPSPTTTVMLGDVVDTVDFGYTNNAATAVAGNYLWSDADNDGQQDPGEPGIGGVTLNLVSAGPDGVFGNGDDVVELMTTTSDDGWYLFSGFSAGEYRVEVTDIGSVLTGYSLTSGPQSSSDPSEPFTVAAGDTFLDADFGYRDATLSTITDRLWQDLDGDGTQDPGELGIASVSVNLLDASGDVIATTLTDADGNFSFEGVADGSYTLAVSDTGAQLRQFVGTTSAAAADSLAVVVAGADVSAVSFGYNQPGIVGDTVFSDANGDGNQDSGELGIEGVTVAIWQDADANGIFDDTVDTFIGNQVTSADGSYLFPGLAQGTYFASVDPTQPALSGYAATTADQEGGANATGVQIEALLANSAASFLAADFGFQNNALPDLSGNIFEDLDRDGVDDGAGEVGFQGVTLELRDSTGDTVAVAVTDSAGDYSFFDVPAGDYTVVVTDDTSVLSGYQLTSGLDQVPVTVAAADISGIDFGYARDSATASIGDFVWLDADGDGIQDGAETGLGGAVLELYDPGPDGAIGGGDDVLVGTTTSLPDGSYLFTGLIAGDYYVQLDTSTLPSGGAGLVVTTSDPTTILALSEGESYPDADFGIGSAPATGSIGDRVWFDADGDGVQDLGEVGIAGIVIELTGPGCAPCTTTTGADGSYLFTGLAPGDYKVDFDTASVPAIYDPTPSNTTGNIDVDGLAGGDLVTNADFGFPAAAPVASIGDTVFLDVDGDGVQDPSEGGIEGISVVLLDSTGTMVLAVTTTDNNGQYTFVGLAAGTYQAQVVDTTGVLASYNLSTANNPTGPIVLTSGQVFTDADFGYTPSGGSGSIGNLVWHDLNGDGDRDAGESGIEGVTLDLWSDTNQNGVIEPGIDNLVRTTVTDLNGEYEFNGLPDGDYLVDVTDDDGVLAGFTKTAGTPDTDGHSQADPYPINVSSSAVVTADFGYFAGSNADILGTVFFDVDANGLEDVVDFGIEQVSVLLYRDLDGDGVIDPSDPRIGTTFVDANGDYVFEDFPPGDYLVAVDAGGTFVDGATQTTQTLTASVEPVTLTGVDSTDNDFGFNRSATLAMVTEIRALRQSGGVLIEWRTAAEAGTAGFRVYRMLGNEPVWVSDTVLSPEGSPQGSHYQVAIPNVEGNSLTLWLEELERSSGLKLYGPYDLELQSQSPTDLPSSTPSRSGRGYQAAGTAPSELMLERLQQADDELLSASRRITQGDALRILVDHDGWFHLSASTLASHFDMEIGDVRQGIELAQLRLSRGGDDVAYLPHEDGLAFLGFGRPDDLYTEIEVYRLEWGSGIHISNVSGGVVSPGTRSVLESTRHLEEDVFAATFVARDPELDYWHWRGLIAGHPSYGSTDLVLELAHPTTDSTGSITVHLRGAGSSAIADEHHVTLAVDGFELGDTYFDGFDDHFVTFDLPAGVLVDGSVLTVTAELDTGVAQSFVYVDSVNVSYDRQAVAVDDHLEGAFGGSDEITAEGFTALDLMVFDSTLPNRPQVISDASIVGSGVSHQIGFGRPAGAETFRIQRLSDLETPQIEIDQPSELSDPNNAGRYLVITADTLSEPAERLAALRLADFGSSRVVRWQDIMDEFAEGRFHPPAVRSFLHHAYRRWAEPPTHVVLMGKGHFDYRDIQGLGGNLMPPMMTGTPFGLYSSDSAFVDFDFDGRPEIALGRIPALTAEEADAYIDKVISYESSSGPWQLKALFMADDDDLGGAFSAEIAQLAAAVPSDITVETGYLAEDGLAALREKMNRALASGVGLVDWMGHGGLDRLADEGVLTLEHLPLPAADDRQPIFALMSCNVARFEIPGFDSLAERLVLASSGGIAVLSPSGLALDVDSFDANRLWIEELYSGGHSTLGEAAKRTLEGYADTARLESDVKVYQLLGDPGLRTGLPILPSSQIFADGFEGGDTSRWAEP